MPFNEFDELCFSGDEDTILDDAEMWEEEALPETNYKMNPVDPSTEGYPDWAK